MTRAIRLTEKHARTVADTLDQCLRALEWVLSPHFDDTRDVQRARDAAEYARTLIRIPAPRPKSSHVRKTEARNATKRTATSKVRREVAKRAGLVCECGCGRWFRGVGGAATMDHFFGVARAESVDTCWLLRLDCHEEKSRNNPTADFWFYRFIEHCRTYGYREAAARAEREAAWRRAKKAVRP